MTTILAHRANLTGPHSVVENSLAACADALARGFGLETDLRRDASGAFYISHDAAPRTPENSLKAYTELFRRHPNAELAINVKELGYEAALIELVNSGQLGERSFYFDFELLEPKKPGTTQWKIKMLPHSQKVRLAARLSDRKEPWSQCQSIPAEVVWGDEFDKLWLTEKEVSLVRAAGRLLYMISPEIHGFDLPTMKRRWQDFKNWGVDGVCTDYPLEAREFFGG
jgi:glycerophosphoryl diester phosphodiesterase